MMIRPSTMTAAGLENRLRHLAVPIVCRVSDDAVLLDVRTIPAEEFETVARMLGEVLI